MGQQQGPQGSRQWPAGPGEPPPRPEPYGPPSGRHGPAATKARRDPGVLVVLAGTAVIVLFGGYAAIVAVADNSGRPQAVIGTAPATTLPGRAIGPEVRPSVQPKVRSSVRPEAGREPASTRQPAAALGDTIPLKGLDRALEVAVTVNKVIMDATPKDPSMMSPNNGVLVAVEVELDNTGEVPYSDTPSAGALLIDDRGVRHGPAFFTDVREGDTLQQVTALGPGNSVSGVIVFETPRRRRPATFQFALDGGLAGQKGQWAIKE
ncbi:DUF4352 domain-containing protein [Planotetraspora sp. A-T 1434]|uniref:DUF4352 domain-containing protein n=1 Tax=Planotetraspora sp. A-T 1434 TaxID=2979219 RepID=UPI0021C0ADDE|nr:DUF4352 domain-containing protein [Planotetraspora sp. A-T 1434]MCT9931188.1 DUF4352 domain-containing protein [Planotetraspora sp. A-T 1434]